MFSLDQLRVLRLVEVDDVARAIEPGSRVLEIGAGTGEQSAELARRGFEVVAIDVASSNYRAYRVFDVREYDGVHIPFPDAYFDVVYSSNVLEHVALLDPLEAEIRRVLKPEGRSIHLVPTPAWRLWSALTVFISAGQASVRLVGVLCGIGAARGRYTQSVYKAARLCAGQYYEAIRQPRHGERGTRLTELHYLTRRWWVRHFEQNGFDVVEARPMGLFYTGYMALGSHMSISTRRLLAPWLGSACNWFVLKVRKPAEYRLGESIASSVESRDRAGACMDRAASRVRQPVHQPLHRIR